MEGRLLLKDCTLLDGGRLRSHQAVVVEGPAVARVGPDADEPVRPGDWAVEARGRLLVPGRIDAHALLPGLEDARRPPTPAEVEALSLGAIAGALRAGTTCGLAQLPSGGDAAVNLAAQARAARKLGFRLLSSLAAEGIHGVAAHDVNLAAVEGTRMDPLVRHGLGFADALSASDELLRVMGRDLHRLAVPVQFRLADSDAQLVEHFELHGRRIVERLERHGLLGPSTIAAHARAIDGAEAALLANRSVLVAWSPLDDLLGELHGFAAVWLPEHRVALGSGGVGGLAAHWTAARTLAHRAARLGRLWAEERLLELLGGVGAADLLGRLFGHPIGVVAPGALADLVLLDQVPAEDEPLEAVLHRSVEVPVAWTVVHGRVVVREGQLLGADAVELLTEAAAARRALR
jgi:5-methylthioadenosine/S-adenosylhomocysteine deaminase